MRRHLSSLLLLLLCSCVAVAATSSRKYFDPGTIPPTLIGPPPAVGGAEWSEEIDHMAAIQAHADPAEIEIAGTERSLTPEMMVLPVEPEMTREKFPHVYQLLERVNWVTQDVTSQVKDYYHTKRPYLSSPKVKPLIEPHDNPSYPSGHTSGGYVWAYVMSMLVPEKRDEFFVKAEQFAEHRVLVGMHYPHDLEGGRKVALLVMGALLQSPDFQADLAEARRELAHELVAQTQPSP